MKKISVTLITPGHSGIEIGTTKIIGKYRQLQNQLAIKLCDIVPTGWIIGNDGQKENGGGGYLDSEEESLAVWDPSSGGFVEIPAYFENFRYQKDYQYKCNDCDVRASNISVKLHDFGIYVVSIDVLFLFYEETSITAAKESIEREASKKLYDKAKEFVEKLISSIADTVASEVPLFKPVVSPQPPLGFHRIFKEVSSQIDPVSVGKEMKDIVHIPSSGVFTDCSNYNHCFTFIGDGNSIFVSKSTNKDLINDPTSIIEYYQYFYAALIKLDKQLLTSIQIADSKSYVDSKELKSLAEEIVTLKTRARMFLSIVEDTVSSFRPQNLAYWNRMVDSWRTREIEQEVEKKIIHFESQLNYFMQKIESNYSSRINNIVTGLTLITVISVIADGWTFVMSSGGNLNLGRSGCSDFNSCGRGCFSLVLRNAFEVKFS